MSNSRYYHALLLYLMASLSPVFFRRASVQELEKPRAETEAEKIKKTRKYSVKGKVRLKGSEKNTDPFQNIGMRIQRF